MRPSFTLAVLSASITGLALAQDGPSSEANPAQPATTKTPVTVVDASANPAAARSDGQAVLQQATAPDFDAPLFVQKVILDDSIPLPKDSVVEVVDGVDTVIEQASGDPFFLGFLGGKHYPAENELLDPALVDAASFPYPDARPSADTYGFVMFSKRITKARVAALEAAGCRTLGFHPHYTVKVAIPADRIGDVSVLDFVRWVGVARTSQKLHPAMEDATKDAKAAGTMRLYVSVFEGDSMEFAEATPFGRVEARNPNGTEEGPEDALSVRWHSNGWMQSAIEELGGTVNAYAPNQATFQVDIAPELVDALLARDFVQFVEPVPVAALHAGPVAGPAAGPLAGPILAPHDESRAMIGSDRIRLGGNGGTNQRTVIGVVDSGIETAHTDINIFAAGWNCTTESSPWDDIGNGTPAQSRGHGTHVTGTILGNGASEPDALGNAPGLASWGEGRLFNYRRFPNPCSVDLDTITDRFSNSFTDGAGTTTRKPHVINNSWGSTLGGTAPGGTEFNARVADDAVFDEDQLWVWSAGNGGPGASTVGIEASAKNSFSVANVVDYISPSVGDPGNAWSSSSRGPTADGRWKPSIAAPGNQIRSLRADNNTGYFGSSGTSMAAPHVTAAAAMLIDRYSSLANEPERMQAILMASAISDNNTTISNEASSHLDIYGAGRLNVYKAALNFGGNTYNSWDWENDGSSWTFADFTVPAGCVRIVAVMTSLEESASAGASQALINDWDFYLDRDPIDPAGNVGEYTAQQSTIDNCELRMVNSPQAGPWRWKVFPDSVTSTTKIGVCVYYIMGDTTPDATFTVTASDTFVQPNDTVSVSATVDTDDYVGSAVVLDRTSTGATVLGTTTTLADGVVTDLSDNWSGGADITLGDVDYFFNRTGSWDLQYATEGTKTVRIDARSDNMVDKSASVQVVVDGTQPGTVGSLASPSHTVGQWSNDPTVQWTWNAAFDALSGIQGYGIFETTSASSPGPTLDINAVTTYTSGAYTSSNSGRYFNIRSVDQSDNWDADFRSAGPYFIDTVAPGPPTLLITSSHPVGVPRCENVLSARYNAGTDANSGIAGYSYFFSTSPTSLPNSTVDTTGLEITQSLAAGTWYLHVRSVDVAGNTGTTAAHFGPFVITNECGTTYCTNNPASTGFPGRIRSTGSDDVSDNNLTIQAYQLPQNTFGLLLGAPTSGFIANPGGSQGNLCLGGAIGRYNSDITNSGASGSFTVALNLTSIPTPTGPTSATAGMSRFWQVWFRDSNPGATSNYTEAIRVRFY